MHWHRHNNATYVLVYDITAPLAANRKPVGFQYLRDSVRSERLHLASSGDLDVVDNGTAIIHRYVSVLFGELVEPEL